MKGEKSRINAIKRDNNEVRESKKREEREKEGI